MRLFAASRASSDFAESFGSSVATVTTGSARASRLPWLVWRITLDSRRAIACAVFRSVSANTTTTEPSSCMAPKSICRIRRLMIRAPSNWARGWAGSKAKRATDNPPPRCCV